jgi:hypothetical protein
MADYINGKEMYAELVVYNAAYKLAMENGEEKPPVSRKLAESFIQIATRLANSFNFCNYTYKDEFIADGIVKCLDKVHRFDPEVSQQAFAFFTQICWNEAILRIKSEQHQSSVKAKLIREKLSSEFVEHGVDSDSDDGSNAFVEFLKENDSYVDYIELRKEIEKEPVSKIAKHRNKTPYAKKAVVAVDVLEEVNLFDFVE